MKIPIKFKLMDQEITVKYDDRLIVDYNCHGKANYDSNEILLSPDSKEFPRSNDQQNHAFYHELLHFIFKRIGEQKLSKNERIIDTIAGLLYQALKTREFTK